MLLLWKYDLKTASEMLSFPAAFCHEGLHGLQTAVYIIIIISYLEKLQN